MEEVEAAYTAIGKAEGRPVEEVKHRIQSGRRDVECIRSRFIFVSLLVELARLGQREVARVLGYDDKSIRNALRTHKNLCETEERYLARYQKAVSSFHSLNGT